MRPIEQRREIIKWFENWVKQQTTDLTINKYPEDPIYTGVLRDYTALHDKFISSPFDLTFEERKAVLKYHALTAIKKQQDLINYTAAPPKRSKSDNSKEHRYLVKFGSVLLPESLPPISPSAAFKSIDRFAPALIKKYQPGYLYNPEILYELKSDFDDPDLAKKLKGEFVDQWSRGFIKEHSTISISGKAKLLAANALQKDISFFKNDPTYKNTLELDQEEELINHEIMEAVHEEEVKN